ncbi:MAG: hypothetical protein K940chlam7_00728 [Chlamydiae bacterium]|nr:hypothetical protein [Chlamydiota bacterium]
MSKYQNILVALDLKPEDDDVVSEQAFRIAETSGATVSFVHVVEPIFNYGLPPGADNKYDQWESELEEGAKMQMSKLGEKCSIPTFRQYVRVGQVKRELLQTAERVRADLIVVGTHCRHGLTSLFFGNTADDVVNDAKCDVLAIHINKG